eukprot:TRINITY_DN67486_c2_g1_i1.p1 TRINITY_DN67486_c2_g1~~TRINITY_DN67486_c2_g1_i1.p1  ORF type:complete len:276 (+),score=38.64 TRINITY_DN67486_c2_g1_i1:128-955(+)
MNSYRRQHLRSLATGKRSIGNKKYTPTAPVNMTRSTRRVAVSAVMNGNANAKTTTSGAVTPGHETMKLPPPPSFAEMQSTTITNSTEVADCSSPPPIFDVTDTGCTSVGIVTNLHHMEAPPRLCRWLGEVQIYQDDSDLTQSQDFCCFKTAKEWREKQHQQPTTEEEYNAFWFDGKPPPEYPTQDYVMEGYHYYNDTAIATTADTSTIVDDHHGGTWVKVSSVMDRVPQVARVSVLFQKKLMIAATKIQLAWRLHHTNKVGTITNSTTALQRQLR